MFKNRYYQDEALQASVDRRKAGVMRQCQSLFTGAGKGVILTGLSDFHQSNKRKMIVLHRDELATQLFEKFRKFKPNLSVGIEMGASYARTKDEIVIASAPTIGREGSGRIKMFHPSEFDIVAVDECHHSTGNSYRNIFGHFGLLDTPTQKSTSSILLYGLTATPNRSDKQGLGQIFDEITYQKSILEGINEGWLVNVRGIKVRTDTSLDSVSVNAGDFADGDLARTVNSAKRNKQIVERWLDEAKEDKGYRQTVAFCADVEHAKQLAATFNHYGIKAEAIWSGDPLRAEKLRRHRNKELTVLTNCGILTEGYDDWQISCIIMARPTKSSLLFTQMAGRGTRIPDYIDNLKDWLNAGKFSDKLDCLLIDVVDNSSRHSLVTLSSLFGLAPAIDLGGDSITDALARVDEVEKQRPYIDLSKLENLQQLEMESVDLFTDKLAPEVADNTKLKWTKVNEEEYQILLPNDERVRVYRDLLGDWSIRGKVKSSVFFQDGLNSLQEAFRLADNFITTLGRDLLSLLRREGSKPKLKPKAPVSMASDLQKNHLRRLYKDNPTVLSKLDSITKAQAYSLMHSFTTGK